MPKAVLKKKKSARVILPDSDKLGFVVGSFLATVVLAINVFFLSVSVIEIVFRVTLTFAVSWVATAIMVHYMVSTTVAEIQAERAAKRRAQKETEKHIEGESGE